jgi:hypothetical protein
MHEFLDGFWGGDWRQFLYGHGECVIFCELVQMSVKTVTIGEIKGGQFHHFCVCGLNLLNQSETITHMCRGAKQTKGEEKPVIPQRDRTERLLIRMGVSEDNIDCAKRELGEAPSCNCSFEKETLKSWKSKVRKWLVGHVNQEGII